VEIETLLTGSRWQMLEHIASRPCSPNELATLTSTTVANVSSQLRLLEAAGIVFKTRTGAADAGKPRIHYRLRPNHVFISRLSSRQVSKRLLRLTTTDSLLLAVIEADVADKKTVVSYVMKHARKFENKILGLSQEGSTTNIGVIGEHDLPSVETGAHKIKVRSVSSLDGYDIQIGDYE